MLFEPARHERLCGTPWDGAAAQRVVQEIAEELVAGLRPRGFWPSHPLDEQVASGPAQKNLYWGAAGVAWALAYLKRNGLANAPADLEALIDAIYRDYVDVPDTGEVVPSYFVGEVGILLVHWRLTRSARTADRLASAIERNRHNPSNEALWGAPGTMLGAWHMWRWTGEERWRRLFVADAEELLRLWVPSKHARCDLWTQDLYGETVQLLGAGHGFAGNVYPLLAGAELLSVAQRERVYEGCLAVLQATCMADGDGLHWPQGVGPPRSGRTQVLVQWCHGAPGIVTALSGFPRARSPEMEDMLRRAGEAVWAAGPLAKGYGLCHGTSGNGLAFLKLYRRTGNGVWLDRARRFAMHAIAQWEQARRRYGRGRYSLWTGDPGLAIYLCQCESGTAEMPGLDSLD